MDKKNNIGWKLFEMEINTRKIYPLFIGKEKETKIGEWIQAEDIPTKNFYHRPGWHVGAELPSAVHLMSADGTYKTQRGKKFKRVWCEVEFSADIDYTHEAEKLPRRCFDERMPAGDGWFYKFKESGNRLWIITSAIKVVRVLSEEERKEILAAQGYDEVAAFAPYKKAFEKRMKTIQNIQN